MVTIWILKIGAEEQSILLTCLRSSEDETRSIHNFLKSFIYFLLLLIQETFIDPMVSKTLEQALWRIYPRSIPSTREKGEFGEVSIKIRQKYLKR